MTKVDKGKSDSRSVLLVNPGQRVVIESTKKCYLLVTSDEEVRISERQRMRDEFEEEFCD